MLEDTITNDKLLGLIDKLNEKKEVHGILLQSPIPKQLDIIKAFVRRYYYK